MKYKVNPIESNLLIFWDHFFGNVSYPRCLNYPKNKMPDTCISVKLSVNRNKGEISRLFFRYFRRQGYKYIGEDQVKFCEPKLSKNLQKSIKTFVGYIHLLHKNTIH